MNDVYESNDYLKAIIRFSINPTSFVPNLFDLADEVGRLKAQKELMNEEEFNEDKELDKKEAVLEFGKANVENEFFGVSKI